MARVCVVGGGTAGVESALEVSREGGDVTIVEPRPCPEPPWGAWPDLILGRPSWLAPSPFRGRVPSTLSAEAVSAGAGYVALKDGRRLGFDFVIVATGTRFQPPSFIGARKPGVSVLDCPERYEELGRACPSLETVLVAGDGFRALEVADRLSRLGVAVRVLISGWERRPPSPLSLGVIAGAARERGAEVGSGGVSRALGNGRVEAAVVDGTVVSCDWLVVAPPRLPNPVRSKLRIGPGGGIEVDATMRTSEPSVYAAGGCAELRGDPPECGVLARVPSMSGRIAGSNCMGGDRSISGTVADELHAFGLRWSRTIAFPRPGAFPSDRETVDHRWGPEAACSITHERRGETVVAVEWVQPSSSPPAGLPPLGPGVTLETLAYGLGSSDISLISEAARLGLREWQRS